jgi:excisionase family DNA binding protein
MAMLEVSPVQKADCRVVEIARQLHVDVETVYRWINRGVRLKSGARLKLEAYRIPGSWRVRREALERFLTILTEDRQRGDDADDAVDAAPKRRLTAKQRAALDASEKRLGW